MKTVSVNIPKIFTELISERTENVSQYIRLAIANYFLSPEAFEEFRNSEGVDYNIIDPIVDLGRYMKLQKEFIGESKKVNVKLSDEFVDLIKNESEQRNLSASKFISILVCKFFACVQTTMCYRSLFDKVWLYKFWRDKYDEIHPDDPDQEYHD